MQQIPPCDTVPMQNITTAQEHITPTVQWISGCQTWQWNNKSIHSIYIIHTLNLVSQTSNISHPLVGNNIVDHSDDVGALPVGAALTTSSWSSFSTWHLASIYCTLKDKCKTRQETFKFGDLVQLILEIWWYITQTVMAPGMKKITTVSKSRQYNILPIEVNFHGILSHSMHFTVGKVHSPLL